MNGLQSELELILHFVNKQMDPAAKPELKRYMLRSEQRTTLFLASLQTAAEQKSKFYN